MGGQAGGVAVVGGEASFFGGLLAEFRIQEAQRKIKVREVFPPLPPPMAGFLLFSCRVAGMENLNNPGGALG